uniref:Uncharacterized protein n=1 Tax=Paramoeba aestuarina TaxID=180227 RepID=A0A7S4NCS2_9EUKA|mmetsp:Transcript_14651/g.22870  ORF Transcript_14651/g.22870 Transcript_14651/m.22870 type:complete len:433 (+) Transcript_14651:1-1299(+)
MRGGRNNTTQEREGGGVRRGERNFPSSATPTTPSTPTHSSLSHPPSYLSSPHLLSHPPHHLASSHSNPSFSSPHVLNKSFPAQQRGGEGEGEAGGGSEGGEGGGAGEGGEGEALSSSGGGSGGRTVVVQAREYFRLSQKLQETPEQMTAEDHIDMNRYKTFMLDGEYVDSSCAAALADSKLVSLELGLDLLKSQITSLDQDCSLPLADDFMEKWKKETTAERKKEAQELASSSSFSLSNLSAFSSGDFTPSASLSSSLPSELPSSSFSSSSTSFAFSTILRTSDKRKSSHSLFQSDSLPVPLSPPPLPPLSFLSPEEVNLRKRKISLSSCAQPFVPFQSEEDFFQRICAFDVFKKELSNVDGWDTKIDNKTKKMMQQISEITGTMSTKLRSPTEIPNEEHLLLNQLLYLRERDAHVDFCKELQHWRGEKTQR